MKQKSPRSRRLNRRITVHRLAASLKYRSRLLYRMSLEAGLALCRPFGEEGRMAAALKRAVWTQRRTYRPRADGKVKLPKEFDAILTRITAGERIAAPELLPYLCLEERAQRAEVNAQLADAYFHASTPEHIAQAKIFAQRAWLLTGFSAELLPLYTRILSATGDTERIREAYKRAGIEAGRQGRIADALRFFELWQYAYHEFDHVDRYEYDFDIMHCVNDLAAPHRFAHDPAQALAPGEKIRLACLVRGMMEINSILIKIDLELAKYRDRSRFDVTIFVPESRAAVLASPQGRDHIAAFEALDYPVVTASDSDNTEEMLLDIAGRIKDFNPHIMVTSAALADFSHYFITSLRPAPIQVGLVQGAPAQFAPPTLDWCIAWTRHPLLDCPVDSSWVRIYLDWPSCDGIAGYNRSEMGIPEDACVLLSGGRQAKFQDPEFWKIIAELLAEHPNAHYLAVGPLMNQIPVFTEIVPQELKPRIRCLGWREDFLRILRIADIAIDTYPNGGGQVVVQAMSMGIPIVAHRNDYMQPFTQTAWSPAEDFLNETDLLVPRGDFARFKQIISRLIEDPQYRREAGERCRAQHVKQADPTAAVRRCEEIYTELVERHLAAQPGSDGARD